MCVCHRVSSCVPVCENKFYSTFDLRKTQLICLPLRMVILTGFSVPDFLRRPVLDLFMLTKKSNIEGEGKKKKNYHFWKHQ